MRALPSLSRRIGLGLASLALLLSAALVAFGLFVHETAERFVWSSLLEAELDHLQERREAGWQWADTRTLQFHQFELARLPDAPLARLPPGLHDEIAIGGREYVALVRDEARHRIVLALDISELEAQERRLLAAIAGAVVVLVLATALFVAWGARRLVRPLRDLAGRIGRLDPTSRGDGIPMPAGATVELAVIAEALSTYVERSAGHVQREHEFIETLGHELRTPIAVMAGAATVALDQQGLPPEATRQLARIRQAARGVETLVSLLLVLARSPERLEAMRERVRLDRLLPGIVEDHRHLCVDKDLALELEPPPPIEVKAPPRIIQAAVGNLVRNAIENSDHGRIRVSLQEGPVVLIEDPGHGLSPEDISALYRRTARGEAGDTESGIGLALISRICAHLGWRLELAPREGGGTRARLDLGQPGAR